MGSFFFFIRFCSDSFASCRFYIKKINSVFGLNLDVHEGENVSFNCEGTSCVPFYSGQGTSFTLSLLHEPGKNYNAFTTLSFPSCEVNKP